MRDPSKGYYYTVGQVVKNKNTGKIGMIIDQGYCGVAKGMLIKILIGTQIYYDYKYENWKWEIISSS